MSAIQNDIMSTLSPQKIIAQIDREPYITLVKLIDSLNRTQIMNLYHNEEVIACFIRHGVTKSIFLENLLKMAIWNKNGDDIRTYIDMGAPLQKCGNAIAFIPGEYEAPDSYQLISWDPFLEAAAVKLPKDILEYMQTTFDKLAKQTADNSTSQLVTPAFTGAGAAASLTSPSVSSTGAGLKPSSKS